MIVKETKSYRYRPFDFPKDFFWGASTSAHQVEGENVNNDWWQFEQNKEEAFRSGIACDHFRQFKKDFSLLEDLGHNTHRLSLEWSRLESVKGEWNKEAFDHYREVLLDLKRRGIKVFLTIHHFTNPLWLGADGWEKFSTPKLFVRFVKKVAEEFDGLVDYWITINEPMVFLYMGWWVGKWPPRKKFRYVTIIKVFLNLVRAHCLAYRAIKKISAKNTPVGIANNTQSFYSYDRRSILALLRTYLIEFATNHLFYLFTRLKYHDFLGMNYYFHHRVVRRGLFRRYTLDPNLEQRERSDMGWELNPDGMFDTLLALNHYKKPIFITECGVATDSEHVRQRFLVNFLKQVHHGISAGVDVRGFFYWSFMDNFEWADGFTPHFGLVEIDYRTLERKPRPTAYLYRRVIRKNQIDEELFKYFGYRTDYNPATDKVA